MIPPCPHCGETHRPRPKRCPSTGLPMGDDTGMVGLTINGRYHLVRQLGDGGMGAVYKAADQILRRFVAIKLLHPTVVENPSSVERFVREARAAAAIGHPNIIDVLDFGYADNAPFLVMEYVRGRSLAHAIGTEDPFAIDRACRIATHTLAGLAAAHDRGILHRDLKPANLLLVARLGDPDFVKICDFGFAALVTPKTRIDDDKKALTPARTLVGTPAYAAPERLRGDDRRDPRLDVYSVGVVLYEMLAGVRPYDAPTFAELARRVRKEPPPPLRGRRPDVPPALEEVIWRALAKDRDDRFADAAEFATALVPFGGREVVELEEDQPSDSFTMDLLKIQARATQRLKALRLADAEQVLATAAGPETPSTLDPPTVVSSPRAARSRPAVLEERPFTPDPQADAPPATPPDWNEITESSPAPRFLPPAPRSPSAPQMIRAPSTPPDHCHFAGSFVIATLQFIAKRFGDRALTSTLITLAPEHAAIFDAGIDSAGWVPSETYLSFVRAADSTLGQDDLHLVVECGRAAADSWLARFHGTQSMPPELFIAELPALVNQWLHGYRIEVRRVGKGYGRIAIQGEETPSLASCVSTLGVLDRALATFGAREAEVNLLTCRALGDHHCLMDVSWL